MEHITRRLLTYRNKTIIQTGTSSPTLDRGSFTVFNSNGTHPLQYGFTDFGSLVFSLNNIRRHEFAVGRESHRVNLSAVALELLVNAACDGVPDIDGPVVRPRRNKFAGG